jgi:hypothetical protein
MRYRCVDAQKAAGFPVAAACQAAGVTRSACYAWTTRATQGPSDHDREEARAAGPSAGLLSAPPQRPVAAMSWFPMQGGWRGGRSWGRRLG